MAEQFTEVEFAGQKVKVPKGGYYDRFHMNPDLDEVAKDPAVGNIDFFRRIPEGDDADAGRPDLGTKLLLSYQQRSGADAGPDEAVALDGTDAAGTVASVSGLWSRRVDLLFLCGLR